MRSPLFRTASGNNELLVIDSDKLLFCEWPFDVELKTQYRLSVKQINDTLGREEEAEREMELAEECAKRLDSLEVPLEKFETRGEKEWVVSDPVPITSRQAGKCRKWLHQKA